MTKNNLPDDMERKLRPLPPQFEVRVKKLLDLPLEILISAKKEIQLMIDGNDEQNIHDQYYPGWTEQDLRDLLTAIQIRRTGAEIPFGETETIRGAMRKIYDPLSDDQPS